MEVHVAGFEVRSLASNKSCVLGLDSVAIKRLVLRRGYPYFHRTSMNKIIALNTNWDMITSVFKTTKWICAITSRFRNRTYTVPAYNYPKFQKKLPLKLFYVRLVVDNLKMCIACYLSTNNVFMICINTWFLLQTLVSFWPSSLSHRCKRRR